MTRIVIFYAKKNKAKNSFIFFNAWVLNIKI